MAGGLFVLPKMHKITQNSLLKKHGIFCLTFSGGGIFEKLLDFTEKFYIIVELVICIAGKSLLT